ncbi:MAG: hypothetical protein WCY27_02915 [archaeon]
MDKLLKKEIIIIPWFHNSKSIIHKIILSELNKINLKVLFIEGSSDKKLLSTVLNTKDFYINYSEPQINMLEASYQLFCLKINHKIPLDSFELHKKCEYIKKEFSTNITIENFNKLRNVSLERVKKWIDVIEKNNHFKKLFAIVGMSHCIDFKHELEKKGYKVEILNYIFGSLKQKVEDYTTIWDEFWNLENIKDINQKWFFLDSFSFENND